MFNIFVKHRYVPTQFMKCVTILLAKCKTVDLSDANNYRAIAISNSISKLLGNVLSVHIKCYDHYDHINFVFPLVVQLVCALACSNKLWTVIHTVVAMFLLAFWTSVKHLTKSVTGNCSINYWIDVGIARLLAFWYSHQQACIYIGMIGSRHFLL